MHCVIMVFCMDINNNTNEYGGNTLSLNTWVSPGYGPRLGMAYNRGNGLSLLNASYSLCEQVRVRIYDHREVFRRIYGTDEPVLWIILY